MYLCTVQGVSKEFQKSGASFLGQSAKKTYLIEGLDRIKQDRGIYVPKILQSMKCMNHVANEYRLCGSLAALDVSNDVIWHGHKFTENLHVFQSVQVYKNTYIDAVKEKVQKYMPDDSMMR